MTADQDRRIADAVDRERSRLRRFIRRRVPDPRDADDILQDVFAALVEADRLLMPIDHVTGWLFRVARNRISDLFRRKPEEPLLFEELLPAEDGDPEAAYTRTVMVEALGAAIAELPPEQRDVFVAHEIDGRRFKDMAATTGVPINTLLSRKHYAVQRLRERLRPLYDELTRPRGNAS
jgi:RNA polymerase sigma factor (sigma-70 family)